MHSHIVKCFHVASLGSEHAFLTNFKPLHHIFTFFFFSKHIFRYRYRWPTYQYNAPIPTMHFMVFVRVYSVSMVHMLPLGSLPRRHSQPSCGWWWASPRRHGTVALLALEAVNGAKQEKRGQFWPFVSTACVCVLRGWVQRTNATFCCLWAWWGGTDFFCCWHGLHLLKKWEIIMCFSHAAQLWQGNVWGN